MWAAFPWPGHYPYDCYGAASSDKVFGPVGLRFDPRGDLWFLDRGGPTTHLGELRRVPMDAYRIDATEISDGTAVHVFDRDGRHERTKDPRTGAVLRTFSYDTEGRLSAITDGYNQVTAIERDDVGRPTAVVAPNGLRTSLTIDARQRLTKVHAPNGGEHDIAYHGATELLATFTEPSGRVAEMTFDDYDRLVRDTSSDGSFWEFDDTSVRNEIRVTKTNAEGVDTQYTLEHQGDLRTRTITAADGSTSVTTKTAATRVDVVADGTRVDVLEGADPTWGWTAAAPVRTTTTLPSGTSRDVQVNRVLVVAGDGSRLGTRTEISVNDARKSFENYDNATRTSTFTSPEGRVSTILYDEHGNVTDVQVPGSAATHLTYDDRGRPLTTTVGSGSDARTSVITYDADTGYASGVTGPIDGVGAQVDSDIMGRVTEFTRADGESTAFSYDVSGNLMSVSPPDRVAHSFTYNLVGSPTSYTAPAATNGATPSVTQTSYRLDRQPLSTTLPDGRVIALTYRTDGKVDTLVAPHGAYQHDYHATNGKLTSITTPEGHTVAWTFDGPLPTSETWSGSDGVQGTVTYGYNNFFEATSIVVTGGTPTPYTYDDDGLVTSVGSMSLARNAATGQLMGTALASTTTSQTYNAFGEIATFDAVASGSSLYSFHLAERDKLGRIVRRDETVEGVATHYEYAYDLAGRLTDVWTDGVLTAHYTFDANGNRLSKTTPTATDIGTYDHQDRVQTYGGFSYVFDAAGVLTSKTNVATNEITAFDYDVLGNLRSVSLADGRLIEYEIDARHRRVGKKVDGVIDLRLIYLNQLEPVAMLDGANNVVATFVYGSKPHVPDFMVRGGVTYRYVTDHLGSVRLVVNASTGAVAQRIDYDEFGVVTLGPSDEKVDRVGVAGDRQDRADVIYSECDA